MLRPHVSRSETTFNKSLAVFMPPCWRLPWPEGFCCPSVPFSQNVISQEWFFRKCLEICHKQETRMNWLDIWWSKVKVRGYCDLTFFAITQDLIRLLWQDFSQMSKGIKWCSDDILYLYYIGWKVNFTLMSSCSVKTLFWPLFNNSGRKGELVNIFNIFGKILNWWH